MARWPVSVKGALIWNDCIVLVHNERDEWELPGGRLEFAETPEECVRREIAEELFIDAEPVALLDTWVYEVLPRQHVLVVTFGCVAEQPAELRHSAEQDDVVLAPLGELAGLALPDGYRRSIKAWADRLYSSPE